MVELNKEYAMALFALAVENSGEEDYMKGLDLILASIGEDTEYLDLLESPAIEKGERVSLLHNAFVDAVPEHVLSFIKVLCEKGHIRMLQSCVEEYRRLFERSRKVLHAKVSSVTELTEDEKQRLQQKLEKISGHSVLLECSIDTTLMGGITIEMDDTVIDGSLRRTLREVKEVMSR